MKIEDSKKVLLRAYPKFAGHITDDSDAKGNEFSEMVLPNPQNENFPLTVTVNAEGCLLSWGSVDYITGVVEIPAESMVGEISEIIGGKSVLLSVYPDEKCFEERRASLCDVYDRDGEKLSKLLSKLQKKLSLFDRMFSKWQGIIELTDWSGDNYRVIRRFFQKKS